MGLLDIFKKNSEGLKDKAADLVEGHSDQVEAGIDKAGDAASKATDGKFDSQIDKGAEAAKDALGKLDDN